MQDKYEALAELLKDEAAAKEVLADTLETTQANLKAKGLDFTVEELTQIVQLQTQSGELDETSLDDVNGGFIIADQYGGHKNKYGPFRTYHYPHTVVDTWCWQIKSSIATVGGLFNK